MRRTILAAFLWCAILGLAVAGCKQGVGQRCQLNSDCEEGLTCMSLFSGAGAGDGVCVGGPDGGTQMDMPPSPPQDRPVTSDVAEDVPADAGDMPADGDMSLDAADLADAPMDRVDVADLPADAAPDAPPPDMSMDAADLGGDGG